MGFYLNLVVDRGSVFVYTVWGIGGIMPGTDMTIGMPGGTRSPQPGAPPGNSGSIVVRSDNVKRLDTKFAVAFRSNQSGKSMLHSGTEYGKDILLASCHWYCAAG